MDVRKEGRRCRAAMLPFIAEGEQNEHADTCSSGILQRVERRLTPMMVLLAYEHFFVLSVLLPLAKITHRGLWTHLTPDKT
jgi:hypothetical protein